MGLAQQLLPAQRPSRRDARAWCVRRAWCVMVIRCGARRSRASVLSVGALVIVPRSSSENLISPISYDNNLPLEHLWERPLHIQKTSGCVARRGESREGRGRTAIRFRFAEVGWMVGAWTLWSFLSDLTKLGV